MCWLNTLEYECGDDQAGSRRCHSLYEAVKCKDMLDKPPGEHCDEFEEGSTKSVKGSCPDCSPRPEPLGSESAAVPSTTTTSGVMLWTGPQDSTPKGFLQNRPQDSLPRKLSPILPENMLRSRLQDSLPPKLSPTLPENMLRNRPPNVRARRSQVSGNPGMPQMPQVPPQAVLSPEYSTVKANVGETWYDFANRIQKEAQEHR